jgi:hypothetical protein
MTGVLPFRPGRQDGRHLEADAEHPAQWHRSRRGKGVEHDARCFAGSNDVHRGRSLQGRHDVWILQGATHESTSVNAIDGGTNNCGEVFAKLSGKLRQRGAVS